MSGSENYVYSTALGHTKKGNNFQNPPRIPCIIWILQIVLEGSERLPGAGQRPRLPAQSNGVHGGHDSKTHKMCRRTEIEYSRTVRIVALKLTFARIRVVMKS